MLDIKFLRENPDIVKENIRRKDWPTRAISLSSTTSTFNPYFLQISAKQIRNQVSYFILSPPISSFDA